ncbi:MAG: hypothetical protein JO044_10020 [Mycobacteriaceae bacterium]|nr:hypothetical protein [Mycobacteriaceae bacterium]
MSRNFSGSGHAEAFIVIAIATILITRLYLQLTGYPQVGGGSLHIAHSLYGGALMMLALLIGWLLLGGGARTSAIVLGGIGFGLSLDEVGKFVTKTNNYFYGAAAEIMYVLVVIVLVGTRVLRTIRPLGAQECLASAALIAADGLARGVGDHQREVGLRLAEQARRGGADPAAVDHVHALLWSCRVGSDRLYAVQQWIPRLIPAFVKSPRWVPLVGWLIVAAAVFSLFFHTLGVALGGFFYRDPIVNVHLAGMSAGTLILLIGALLTLAMALPAMIAPHRTDSIWPLRLLRDAALLFTLLSALVHFATEGFAALISLSIGLLAMAILSYQLHLREQAEMS